MLKVIVMKDKDIVSEKIDAKVIKVLDYVMYEHRQNKSDVADNIASYNHCVNAMIKGKRRITVNQLYRLIRKYDINPSFIFGDDLNIGKERAASGIESEIVTAINLARRNPDMSVTDIAHMATENPKFLFLGNLMDKLSEIEV